MTELHGAFNFVVQLDGEVSAEFTECTLPSLEVEILEQKDGGYNTGVHLLPGPVKSGRLTLKRGVIRSNELLKWYSDVASGKVTRRSVSVVMLDSELNTVFRLDFEKAFPVKWTGPTFKTSDSSAAIESLELAYRECHLG